jgi:hypothetical protein
MLKQSIKNVYVRRRYFILLIKLQKISQTVKTWELYPADIKVKSDKSRNKSPESVFVNNALLTDTFEITNAFNSHFSSFSPDISITDTDCRHFIFKSFQNMNKVSDISSSFDFTDINRDE